MTDQEFELFTPPGGGKTKPISLLTNYITLTELLNNVEIAFADSASWKDVTSWMDLIRTCRQPQVMWEVDYIEPKKGLNRINDIIRQSEDILYESKYSIDLKPCYTTDLSAQSAFNTIRMHLRAEESDIDGALKILDQMISKLYDELPTIRQSQMLFHACLIYLCCKEFNKSHEYFEKHWALTKYASPSDRISLGIIDNQVLLQMVYWFFIKYSNDFQDFYVVKNKIKVADIWGHKKISLLYFLEYDPAWAISLCSLAFYNHAQTWAQTLPTYEKKRSTPTNVDKIWMDDERSIFSDNVNLTGPEKVYFEMFNRELSVINMRCPEFNKSADYLYSYYHYQTDYAALSNLKMSLVFFLKKFIDVTTIDSIIEVGSGINMCAIPGVLPSKHIAVDISEKVCEVLRETHSHYAHADMCSFISETEDHFDLCFACDVLASLSPYRLQTFLTICREKCKYLAAIISTENNIKTDILSSLHHIRSINLHKTVQSAEDWTKMLSKDFDIETKIEGNLIYVFGKSKP